MGAVLLGLASLVPLPGCVGLPPPPGLGQLATLALTLGASVGSYYLIRELD